MFPPQFDLSTKANSYVIYMVIKSVNSILNEVSGVKPHYLAKQAENTEPYLPENTFLKNYDVNDLNHFYTNDKATEG
jgi:hypothetical protein